MALVFLACRPEDRPSLSRLLDDLRARGVDTWIGIDRIEPGADWRQAVKLAIEGAAALIYVLSHRSSGSLGVVTQVFHALAKRIPVFAITFEDPRPDPLPNLRQLQYVDLHRDYAEALDRLLSGLSQTGVVPVDQRRPLPPSSARSKGYVFLSYAAEDADFVNRLKGFLKRREYAFWDFLSSQRNYQERTSRELEEAIRDAKAVVSVLSPDWKVSAWTEREYLYANDIGIPTFLVRARALEPTLLVSGRTLIDFVKNEREVASRGV
jgi:hypothetical protein